MFSPNWSYYENEQDIKEEQKVKCDIRMCFIKGMPPKDVLCSWYWCLVILATVLKEWTMMSHGCIRNHTWRQEQRIFMMVVIYLRANHTNIEKGNLPFPSPCWHSIVKDHLQRTLDQCGWINEDSLQWTILGLKRIVLVHFDFYRSIGSICQVPLREPPWSSWNHWRYPRSPSTQWVQREQSGWSWTVNKDRWKYKNGGRRNHLATRWQWWSYLPGNESLEDQHWDACHWLKIHNL